MALLAVMVDVGTSRLRQAQEMLHAQQALAAADAGTAWVRGLLSEHSGDLLGVITDLKANESTMTFAIDANTNAEVAVGLYLPGAVKHTDHLDVNLQANAQIAEAPLQVVATASINQHGRTLATRTVTTLIRTFALAPYSEVVGVVDDAGVLSTLSPGDPGGQFGGAYTTDLRIHAYTETGSGPPVPADVWKNDAWSDGNLGGTGILP
jgi:hypothetical protein